VPYLGVYDNLLVVLGFACNALTTYHAWTWT